MKRSSRNPSTAPSNLAPRTHRCAIYTRKSTEDGLSQEFNSLDAQREAAEAFIRSQTHEGWQTIPEHYDDGGFTGGNIDRPALQKLLVDIEAGKIDCVVVYKVDRLSRSLLDFSRLMETFDRKNISFVSVTQQFNTTHSMGRLTLNILLSFAQFEREIISERTRDKIAATRRKGKWTGGRPLLGYGLTPDRKLTIIPEEAERVRAIFTLYRDLGSLLPVVEELVRRNWTNKEWTTRSGTVLSGKPFHRTSLYQLLTNVVYTGRVRYKTEIHPGEQPAIIDPELWDQVQKQLALPERIPRSRGFHAPLKGLLRCVPCGCAMTPSHSSKHRRVRYRYYVCSSAQRRGWKTCPSKSIPARVIEDLVLDQLRQAIPTQTTFDSIDCWVSRVDYDGGTGKVQIHFRATAPIQSATSTTPPSKHPEPTVPSSTLLP